MFHLACLRHLTAVIKSKAGKGQAELAWRENKLEEKSRIEEKQGKCTGPSSHQPARLEK